MPSEHIQVVIASGPDDPKRLMLGLSMAASATSAGTIVHLFLAMDGTRCLRPDVCDRVLLEGYPTVAELLAVVQEGGGVLEYCPHCLPAGCQVGLAQSTDHQIGCGCKGMPAGLVSYGVRLGDWPTVVF